MATRVHARELVGQVFECFQRIADADEPDLAWPDGLSPQLVARAQARRRRPLPIFTGRIDTVPRLPYDPNMRSVTTVFSDRIHSSAEEIVSALERAADSLGGDDLTQVLITAISHRGQIDATIASIVGGFDDVTDEEQLHRRRHLDVTEGPNGGYVLTGYLDPKGGAMVKGALDAVIEREDTKREAARREPVSSRQPPAWPLSSQASAVVEPPAKAGKVGRNHPCPCRSGRKHKNCCGV